MGGKKKEQKKIQLTLWLPAGLYDELASWAEDDFRSLNGQVLNTC